MTCEFLILIAKSILYGIVEGITEWLPVSSTGHLIILKEFVSITNVSSGFMDMFDVVIQLGAIMAVVVIFFNKLWPFTNKTKNHIDKEKFNMWYKILIACIPGILIIPFDDYFNRLFYNPISVSIALIAVGIIFILVEVFNKKKATINSIKQITFKTAFIIGLFQITAAIFPGVSRSGATIIGALLIGVKRETAAEFTFFLAIPAMFGASLLKLVKFGLAFTGTETVLLITGMLSAFIISLFVIRFLMNYIKKHDFKIFGIYRIIIGIIILMILG